MNRKGTAMWDDIPGFLVGTGPTATVLDPDGTPNTILDVLKGGSVRVNFAFAGGLTGILADLEFTVTLYADPVGPAPNVIVGTHLVKNDPGPSYSVTIPIAANSLAADAYRLTTLVTTVIQRPAPLPPAPVPIAGFVDGPIIQVRPGP